eukprot:1643492-Pleurochrysis_carterae.AAC.1
MSGSILAASFLCTLVYSTFPPEPRQQLYGPFFPAVHRVLYLPDRSMLPLRPHIRVRGSPFPLLSPRDICPLGHPVAYSAALRTYTFASS